MLEFRELGFARLCVEGALGGMATGVAGPSAENIEH